MANVEKITVGGPVIPPVNSGNSFDDEFKLVQLELMKRQLADDDEKRQARANLIAAGKAQRASYAKETINAQEKEKLAQARCAHRTDRGTPDTGAQRDYNGNIILLCQICFKQWNQGQPGFPSELVHPNRIIGGYGSE